MGRITEPGQTTFLNYKQFDFLNQLASDQVLTGFYTQNPLISRGILFLITTAETKSIGWGWEATSEIIR
jgi:hypothetical protein